MFFTVYVFVEDDNIRSSSARWSTASTSDQRSGWYPRFLMEGNVMHNMSEYLTMSSILMNFRLDIK